MTAQTPAPAASSAPLLPAPLSKAPPSPPPAVKEDFLAMILQALTAKSPATEQPAKEKPATTEAAVPDQNTMSQLLALLVPPLPVPLKEVLHKAAVHSVPVRPVGLVGLVGPVGLSTAATPAPGKPQRPVAAATLPETKTPPPSGTPAANTKPSMNLSSERNEVAGKIEQKLPLTAISAAGSADTGGPSPDGGSKMPLPFSWQETPSEQVTIMDLSTKIVGPVAPVAASMADAPVRVAGPAPLDRVEQMISREVLTVRQTGAQTLGVSLNLDSNTQLFLQLTNNNGQVQASVRCDRGQFAPEDAQWAQLQQSLAKQNVELLPMTGSANLNFQQPSGDHRRQQAAREDWPAANAAVPPAQQRKQKEQNRPRKNWESWA